MKKYFMLTGVMVGSFFTIISSASAQAPLNQANDAISTLGTIVTNFTDTLGSALGQLAMAAGVIAFFYGVVQYIWGVREAKPEVIKTGNQFMMYGLLALFVMFSVYGIIKFGQNIFFSGDINTITIPEVKFKRGNSTSPSPSGKPSTSDPMGSFIRCPDGVTEAVRLADCPSYTCPDGTVYYNLSDRNTTCGSSAAPSGYNPTTSSSAGLGDYCNRDIRCGQGTCVNSVCTSSAFNPTTSSSAGLGEYCNRDIRCGQGICSGSVCVIDAPLPDQLNQSTRGTAQCDTLTAQECPNYNDINTNAPCSWDSVERQCLPN